MYLCVLVALVMMGMHQVDAECDRDIDIKGLDCTGTSCTQGSMGSQLNMASDTSHIVQLGNSIVYAFYGSYIDCAGCTVVQNDGSQISLFSTLVYLYNQLTMEAESQLKADWSCELWLYSDVHIGERTVVHFVTAVDDSDHGHSYMYSYLDNPIRFGSDTNVQIGPSSYWYTGPGSVTIGTNVLFSMLTSSSMELTGVAGQSVLSIAQAANVTIGKGATLKADVGMGSVSIGDSSKFELGEKSLMTLSDGAKFVMDSGAVFEVNSSSKMTLNSGAKVQLNKGAEFAVDSLSSMVVGNNSILYVMSGMKFKIHNHSSFTVSSGSNCIVFSDYTQRKFYEVVAKHDETPGGVTCYPNIFEFEQMMLQLYQKQE